MTDLLAARVQATPDATFLLWGEERWSYSQAWQETLKMAAWAQARGIEPGTRLASYLPNRPEAIWAWFGTLAAGGTYVPLNRSHRGPVLLDMLERADAQAFVTDIEGLEAFPPDLLPRSTMVADAESPQLVSVDGRQLLSWADVAASEVGSPIAQDPGDLAELIYTSGTTGRSKSVRLTHTQLCRGAGWIVWSLGLGPDDVFHAWLPLFHIAGQADSVLPMIISGGAVALQPTFSRSCFFDQVRSSSSTIFIGFSNVAELLLTLPEDETSDHRLRAGVVGAVSGQLRQRFEKRFGVVLHDVYGMTEAEPIVLPHPGDSCPAGSCGRPNPDLEVAMLGVEDMPVEPGSIGEISVRPRRADVVTSGYQGDPVATLEATRGLWFRTGDLGRTDSHGFVYFVDRLKHSIRRRGENISSWELENTVLGHPAVEECCALAIPSPLGEDDVKIVVGVGDGRELDPKALHDWCQAEMARFMVPRYIDVVSELPRAPTGKVVKEELRANRLATWDAEAEA